MGEKNAHDEEEKQNDLLSAYMGEGQNVPQRPHFPVAGFRFVTTGTRPHRRRPVGCFRRSPSTSKPTATARATRWTRGRATSGCSPSAATMAPCGHIDLRATGYDLGPLKPLLESAERHRPQRAVRSPVAAGEVRPQRAACPLHADRRTPACRRHQTRQRPRQVPGTIPRHRPGTRPQPFRLGVDAPDRRPTRVRRPRRGIAP